MPKTKTRRLTFRRGDHHRLLLTDTLPYEVPVLFSNTGFYDRLFNKCPARIRDLTRLNLFDDLPFTVPYVYKIRKNAAEDRTLFIAHPTTQLQWAKFLHTHSQLIIGLCAQSSFSLRQPSRVASRYFEKTAFTKSTGDRGSVEVDAHESTQEQASSFFAYRQYNLIHKFYDSTEFHALERRFSRLRKLDISKCFPHIYTHSISWAVRSKEFAKNHRSAETFDATFDRLMRHANYDETNGIVVGPEISRIFAEIILQRIDKSTQQDIARQHNLVYMRDYAIRRYVDDFFVFANSEGDLDAIQRILSHNLEEYKLYLNSAKTVTQVRPFLSGQTAAKVALAELIERLFAQHTITLKSRREELSKRQDILEGPLHRREIDLTPVAFIRNPGTLAASYIRDIKTEITINKTDYESVTNHLFTVLRKHVLHFLDQVSDQREFVNAGKISSFIAVVMDVAFFIFAMSPRARNTYQLAQICLAIKDMTTRFKGELEDSVSGHIAGHLKASIEAFSSSARCQSIELLNLLIVLNQYGRRYRLSEHTLRVFFGLRENGPAIATDSISYFQILTLLYYIGSDQTFTSTRELIYKVIETRLSSVNPDEMARSSELTMLFLDCLSCPHAPMDFKVKLAKTVLRKVSDRDINTRCRELITLAGEGDWFFSWRSEPDIQGLFWKKELKPAY